MKIFTIILFALLSSFAHAGNWGVQYHFLSNHFEDRGHEDWNEETLGFGLRYTLSDKWAVQFGHYRNEFSVRSHSFTTGYVGADYTPWQYGPVRLGGYGWLTSGYDAHVLAPNPGDMAHPSTVVAARNQGILPAVGLVACVEYKQFNYTLRVHTNLPGAVPAAVMSAVGWSFK